MYSTKLGAIAAMLIAGQALGQTSQITYKLELSHGATANNRTAWKSTPCADQPLFDTSGASSANGLSYNGVLTWDARVFVAGSHATGTPQGVANVVFTLELKDNNGVLVAAGKATNSTDSPGIPGGTTGYYSTINDNTNPGSCHATDGNEGAAFAVYVSSPDPQYVGHGRLIDTAPGFGPGFDYFQYPSCGENANYPTGFPAGAGFQGGANANGVKPGQLAGMGAGYSKFVGTGCPGGGNCGLTSNLYSAGVGTAPACGLGSNPIAEGQINLAGLAAGTYTLSLVPGTGNNILKGDIACGTDGDVGDFAVAPDLATQGASVSFIVSTGACVRTVVGRHLFYNNSYYDTAGTTGTNPCNTFWAVGQLGGVFGPVCSDNTAVSNNRIALLPGLAPLVPPTATGHGLTATCNYSSYTKGINGIMIDVGYAGCTALPAGALTGPQIASTLEFMQTTGAAANRVVTAPYTVARVPTSVTIAPHPTLATTDRVTIIFADNTSANASWLRTRILPGGVIAGITPISGGDLDRFYYGLAIADGITVSAANVLTNATDQSGAQADPHSAFARPNIEDRNDYNKDGLVSATDQTAAKAPNVTTSFTCLQLGGVAP